MGIADRLPDVDRRWLILLLVLLLVIVGIGIGGLPEEQDEEPGTARLSVTTPTPTPTPTPTAGGSGAPTGGDAATTQTPGGEDTPTTTERGTTSEPTPSGSETPTRTERDDDRGPGGGGGGGGETGSESNVHVQVAGSGARIAYADAVPGTADRADLVLTNVGNGTGQLVVGNVTVRDLENGITEPEAAVDDTPDTGELSEHVMVVVEAHDPDGTVEYLYGTESGPRSLASIGTESAAETDVRLDPGEEARIVVDWHIPESTGDEIQSDATQFDLVFGLRAASS